MSVVNNNHVKITDYLPTKAQLVRSMGYAATGTCNIAALGAAYIATIQAARRTECMTGITLNEIPFEAGILDLDAPGTYALVPAAFAAAAVGFHKLAPKIHAYTTAWAQTLEAAPKKPIDAVSSLTEAVKESFITSTSKAEAPSALDDKVKDGEVPSLVSDQSASESEGEIKTSSDEAAAHPLVNYSSHSSDEGDVSAADVKLADTQIENADLHETSEA